MASFPILNAKSFNTVLTAAAAKRGYRIMHSIKRISPFFYEKVRKNCDKIRT